MIALTIPETCAIAFKEWTGVCDALAEGRQVLIFRKGGIAEGPQGFVPEHNTFWLYPTLLHQGQQGLRTATDGGLSRAPASEQIALRALATVVSMDYVERVGALDGLAGEHVWTDDTVRGRFFYKQPGLWVLVVRVHLRTTPWMLNVTARHAGCRSWVPLDEPIPTAGMVAALDDVEFERRSRRVRAALLAREPGDGA